MGARRGKLLQNLLLQRMAAQMVRCALLVDEAPHGTSMDMNACSKPARTLLLVELPLLLRMRDICCITASCSSCNCNCSCCCCC